MILYLVRHGNTDYNDQKRCQGTTDLPLNELGKRQAAALGERFSGVDLNAVYASPMIRAMETAKAIALPQKRVEIYSEPGLMELDQGELEGMDMADMAQSRPELIKSWFENPADTVIPGGESMSRVQERTWEVVERIGASHAKGERVVAVSHNLALSTLVCKVLNLPIAGFRRFRLAPAGVTSVDFGGRWPVIVSLNDTSHLDGLRG